MKHLICCFINFFIWFNFTLINNTFNLMAFSVTSNWQFPRIGLFQPSRSVWLEEHDELMINHINITIVTLNCACPRNSSYLSSISCFSSKQLFVDGTSLKYPKYSRSHSCDHAADVLEHTATVQDVCTVLVLQCHVWKEACDSFISPDKKRSLLYKSLVSCVQQQKNVVKLGSCPEEKKQHVHHCPHRKRKSVHTSIHCFYTLHAQTCTDS